MPSTLSWANKISTQVPIHEGGPDELGTLSTIFETARTHHSLETQGSEALLQTPEHRVQELDQRPHVISSSQSVDVDLHSLMLGQAPQARVLFLQADKPHLTTKHVETIQVPVPGEHNDQSERLGVLGVVPNPAETGFSGNIRGIQFTMDFTPLTDEVLLCNQTREVLFLESMPNKLAVSEILPNGFAVVYSLPGYWQLRGNLATIKFLVRPPRDRAFITEIARKRPIDQTFPSLKKAKYVTETALTGATEDPAIHDQKMTSRFLHPWDGAHLGRGQIVNMVDGVTGQVKYTITIIGEHTNKHGPAYVFKADWQDGSLEPEVVAFKVFKNPSTTPDGFLRSARNWKRELQVLRRIRHVSPLINLQTDLLMDRANSKDKTAADCQPCRLRRLCIELDDRISQFLRSCHSQMVH